MGLFQVRVRIFSLSDEHQSREVEVVVDTGATYSIIPAEIAHDLGIRAIRERTFTLADGRQMTRRLGEARLAYDGVDAPGFVVIGEPGDVPLLGATTLDMLGMEVDPVAQTLRPTTLYLL
jgi:clan AA aspartic protease